MLLHHRSSKHDAPRSLPLAAQHNPEKPPRYAKQRDATAAPQLHMTSRIIHDTQTQIFVSKLQVRISINVEIDFSPLAEQFFAYLPTFFLSYHLTFFDIFCISLEILSGTSSHIVSDILSGILCIYPGILSGISSDILSGISSDSLSDSLSDTPSDVLSDILSDILYDISSDVLSDILPDILSGTSSGILSDIVCLSLDILSGTSCDVL